MESAMARVKMIIGAEAAMGVILIPENPAKPMATILDRKITDTVATVPAKVLKMIQVKTKITKNMMGTSVVTSVNPASEKAWFNMETPVNEISRPG